MEKGFYPECQGALKELGGQEEGKMRYVGRGEAGREEGRKEKCLLYLLFFQFVI